MELIGRSRIYSILSASNRARIASNYEIRNDRGHRVTSYIELARAISELQYLNPDHVLLFRGQGYDYQSVRNNSSIKPSIFRPLNGSLTSPSKEIIAERYRILAEAEHQLTESFASSSGRTTQRLLRQRILRWAILQHYDVCRTPLLDVTQSLRIAASFAILSKPKAAFVYVFGVPNISGAVTASAEAGLQIIRLSSVCPPSAVRPHIQEGFLLGEYPEMTGPDQKALYRHYEIDFALRLIAKFRFEPSYFISNRLFPMISRNALYPSSKVDFTRKTMDRIRKSLPQCQ